MTKRLPSSGGEEPISRAINDPERLRALDRTALLDSAAEDRFDRLTRIAARALDAPVALVSLVDKDRQFFKSAIGLPEPWATCRQTPLSHSFCQLVVASKDILRVTDARSDKRVATNLAVSELGVVAYLGAPLKASGGSVIGSLCVIDVKPREWTADDERLLADVAAIVEDQIGLASSERRWREILNTMPQMVWSTLPDGFHDFYNDRWYEFTGVPHGSTDGEGWNGMFHPDDQERAWARWRQSLSTGTPYEIEYRLRHRSGAYRWALGRALPVRDDRGAIERWFGTCTDIDDIKRTESELKESAEARDLMARELSHRIQNIFAVVGSLVATSARRDPSFHDFGETVRSRIRALARAHQYVKPGGFDDPDRTLRGLFATLLKPYEELDGAHTISISGDDVAIGARTATALALALHELATNAVKYGALSADGGLLSLDCEANGDTFKINWRERGGPPIAGEPSRAGFGSELLVSSAVTQLGARLEKHWAPEGLTVEITLPAKAMNS